MSKQDKQPVVAPAAVVAAGLASATAAIVTSKFGVAGTIGGAALTSMIVNGGSAIYRAYIERASSTIRDIPSAVQIRTDRWGAASPSEEADSPSGRAEPQYDAPRGRLRAALGWFSSLPGRFGAALGWFSSLAPLRRRSILIGALIAGVVSLLLSIGTVTGVELGVGKSLSCWVWNDCPVASSADGGKASSTRPSIFGGGQSASSSSSQAEPFNSQQQPAPGVPESPSQTPPGVPGSEEKPSPPLPGQRWSPSGNPSETPSGNPSDASGEQQQEAQPQQQETQPRSPSEDSKNQPPGNQGSMPSVRPGREVIEDLR